MDFCAVCNKKVGFFAGAAYPIGDNLYICGACEYQRRMLILANDGVDNSAQDKARAYFERHEETYQDDRVKDIISTWYQESEIHQDAEQNTEAEETEDVTTYDPEIIRKKELVFAEYRKEKENDDIYDVVLYSIKGCRGRKIRVYKNRIVIDTNVTLGSIISSNATDGEKTIFYKDIVGIQFKIPGVTIGYLQLETSSQQMNNVSSNVFSENTFTFNVLTDEIMSIEDCISTITNTSRTFEKAIMTS